MVDHGSPASMLRSRSTTTPMSDAGFPSGSSAKPGCNLRQAIAVLQIAREQNRDVV
jgi:hypothetical protein